MKSTKYGYAPPRSTVNKLKDEGYIVSSMWKTRDEALRVAEQFRQKGCLARAVPLHNPVAIDRGFRYAVMYKFKPEPKGKKR